MHRTVRVLVSGCAAAMLLSGCSLFQSAPSDEMVELAEPPRDTAANLMLADAAAARKAGDYETALAMFRDILAENPTVTAAYMGMGDIYMEQRDYEKAEPAFARAARFEPQNFDAQYYHGLALQMLNRLADAIKAYHRALTIDPANSKANLNMATTYLQMGDAQGALVFAQKAVKSDPADGAARVNLGAVYERIGRDADAIEQYDAALELMEPTAPLLMNLLNALGRQNRYEEARNTAEVLIRLEPSANAYERLGWARFRLKDFAGSLAAYRSGVQINPGHWPSLNGVGVNSLNAWLLSGKTDSVAAREAREALRSSLRANRDQPKIIKLLSDYGL